MKPENFKGPEPHRDEKIEIIEIKDREEFLNLVPSESKRKLLKIINENTPEKAPDLNSEERPGKNLVRYIFEIEDGGRIELWQDRDDEKKFRFDFRLKEES